MPNTEGMSYKQASTWATALIAQAHRTGNWFDILDALVDLRKIMQRHLDAA